MNTNAEVIHLAAGAFHLGCSKGEGGTGFKVSPFRADVTCPDCRANIDVAMAVNLVPTDPAALAAATAELEAEFPDDDPAIACSSMHEHDPARCAAPSVAEMNLEMVGVELADLYARILGVFEDEDASTEYALSQVGDRIEALLKTLRMPVPAAAFTPSSVCPTCEAKLTFNRWGGHSEAWVAEQVRLHIESHDSAPVGTE